MARRLKGELVKVRSVQRQHNKRLKLPARVDYGNESFFFSAPQLKRDPLGSAIWIAYQS
jgi:hypothetical protein